MKRKTGEKQKIRVSSRDQCELFKAKLDSCGAVRDAIKLAHRSNLINRNPLTTSSLFFFFEKKKSKDFLFHSKLNNPNQNIIPLCFRNNFPLFVFILLKKLFSSAPVAVQEKSYCTDFQCVEYNS